MIACKVPIRTALWLGTGTVVVPPSPACCMTMWLPRRRTCANPCRARIAHTWRPDRTRSLPNFHLDLRYEELARQPTGDFLGGCALEEEFQRFLEVVAGFLD